jgi:hypothetical protein
MQVKNKNLGVTAEVRLGVDEIRYWTGPTMRGSSLISPKVFS